LEHTNQNDTRAGRKVASTFRILIGPSPRHVYAEEKKGTAIS